MLIEPALMVRALAPPLDPDRLPATAAGTPRAESRARARSWFLLATASFAVIAPFVLVIDLTEGFPDPLQSLAIAGAAPAVFSAIALMGLWRARRQPERLAVSLSRDEVVVESSFGRVARPVAEFAGIAVLHHLRAAGDPAPRRPPSWRDRRPVLARAPAAPEVLTAIVLVHPEPAESVPLRAFEGPRPAPSAPALAERFAAALGLPLLAPIAAG